MIKTMEFIPLLYGVSVFIFNRIVDRGLERMSLVIICLGVIYKILPQKLINEKIWKLEEKKNVYEGSQNVKYMQHSLEFEETYERSNPVTQAEAFQEFYRNFSQVQSNKGQLSFLRKSIKSSIWTESKKSLQVSNNEFNHISSVKKNLEMRGSYKEEEKEEKINMRDFRVGGGK